MSPKNYYNVLGITKNASDDDIRKAYRKQALRFHPDKNLHDAESAKQMFQDVAEAWDVLSDKTKKEAYDTLGDDGAKETNQPPPDFNTFPSAQHGDYRATPLTKSPPIIHELPLSLEELYHGCMKNMKVTRLRNSLQESTVLPVGVHRGWKAGTKVTFQNEGDDVPNMVPADIVFVIQEKKHRLFTRSGNNLLYETRISLKQSLSGFSVELIGIDGQKLRVRVKPLTSTSYRKVVQGHGMPLSKHPETRGNLVLSFVVEFPTNLSGLQRQQLLTNL